ncbi:hypothetical protein COD17_10180 [Bacillus thuringiensis]|nr:hypothetical protein COD17_10180 [Bacillus thuringiensis]
MFGAIKSDLEGLCEDIKVVKLPTFKGILWDRVKGCVFFCADSDDYTHIVGYLERKGYGRTQVMEADCEDVDEKSAVFPYCTDVRALCRRDEIDTKKYNRCFIFHATVVKAKMRDV